MTERKAEVKTSVMSRKYAEFRRTIKHHVRFTQTKDVYASPCIWDSGVAFKVVLYSLGFQWSSPWLKKHVKMRPHWLQWVGLHGCLWRHWINPYYHLGRLLCQAKRIFHPRKTYFFWSPEPLVSDVVFTVAPKQDKPSHLPPSRGRLAIWWQY